jgi:hypothetical protein
MGCRRADIDTDAGEMNVRPDGALMIVSVLAMPMMLVS